MANNFKKIIAGISVAAILATTLAVPVMAETDEAVDEEVIAAEADTAAAETDAETAEIGLAGDDDDLYSVYYDFDDLTQGMVMTLNGQDAAYVELDGLKWNIGSRSNSPTGTNISISSGGVTGNCIALNSRRFASAERMPYIDFIAPVGATNFMMSAQIKVTNGSVMYYGDSKTVLLNATDGAWHDYAVYMINGTRTIKLDNETILTDKTASLPSLFGYSCDQDIVTYTNYIDNVTIAALPDDIEVPEIQEYTVANVEVGETVAIAAVSNADDVELTSTNDAFSVSYDAETGLVSVVAADAGSTVITVTAKGIVNTVKTFNISATSAEELAQAIADSLDIASGNSGVTKTGDDEFSVSSNFTVPLNASNASVEWAVSQAQSKDSTVWSSTSFARISNDTVVISPDETTSQYIIKLTATVTYKGKEASKDFYLSIKALGLDDFEYYNIPDEFTIGEDDAMEFSNTAHVDFFKSLVVTADVKLSEGASITLTDDSSNTVEFAVPAAYAGQWIQLVFTTDEANKKTNILVYDEDGGLIEYQLYNGVIYTLASISAAGADAAVRNLIIADRNYEISDSMILESAVKNLELDADQWGMSGDRNGYTVERSFELPAAPDKTTVAWSVEQSAAGADNWTAAEYAAVNNTTKQVEVGEPADVAAASALNYRIVAKITAGSENATVYFPLTINFPAPDGDTIYYSDGFTNYGTGNLVTLNSPNNNSYEKKYGLTFTTGSRDGSSDAVNNVSADASNGTLTMLATQFYDSSRQPRIALSRTSSVSIKKNLVLSTDITFGSTDGAPDKLIVSDSSSKTIEIVLPDETYVGETLTLKVIVTPKNKAYVFMYHNGDPVYYAAGVLNDIAMLTVPTDQATAGITLKGLYISDIEYTIDNNDIAAAGANSLALPVSSDTAYPIIANGAVYEVIDDFTLPSNPSDTTVVWTITDTNGNATTEASIAGGNVVISPSSDCTVVLHAAVTSGDATATRDFRLNLKTPETVMKDIAEDINLIDKSTGRTPKLNNGVYELTNDLALDTGDYVTVSWSSTNNAVTSTGAIMPGNGEQIVTVTATLSYKGVTTTKTFDVKIPDAVSTYINPVIEALTVSSADDATVSIPADSIGTVNYDVQLPTTVKASLGQVDIEWAVEGDAVTLTSDNVAEYLVSDRDAHAVTLTPTFKYVKDNVTLATVQGEPYTYSVQFDDSAAGKYKVRMDAAYDANFTGIPSSTNTSLTLPSSGAFGSAITWNSNAPTVISNEGKFTTPSSSRTVTLTAKLTSGSESAEKTFTISVAGSGSTGGGGGGGGSTSSTGTTSKVTNSGSISTGTVASIPATTNNASATVDRLLEEAAAANDLFSDIGEASWAREAINGLAAAGIVNGKSETSFAPNDTVTRAEFAKMLMGTFGLTANAYSTSSFRDVAVDAWYFDAVETAYNLGIILGVEDGVFAPDALITRQDMAVMVSRAVAVTGTSIAEVAEAKAFDDSYAIAAYAVNAVDQLVKGGIINGMSDTEFAPLSNATRAQAAKILYSFL